MQKVILEIIRTRSRLRLVTQKRTKVGSRLRSVTPKCNQGWFQDKNPLDKPVNLKILRKNKSLHLKTRILLSSGTDRYFTFEK